MAVWLHAGSRDLKFRIVHGPIGRLAKKIFLQTATGAMEVTPLSIAQKASFTVVLAYCSFVLTGCGGSPSSSRGSVDSNRGDPAQPAAVWTYHNDNQRSGLNQTETTLTPVNVQPATFGKIAMFPVEGYVYAQPLYVPNVTLGSGSKSNLLFVATEHDQLYAFDVDSKQQVWHTDYLAAGPSVSTLTQDDVNGCKDIVPEIGITGTPVIDTATQTLYVVVRTKETVDGSTVFLQRVHAVSLATGQDVVPPMVVSSPPPGYTATGVAQFDPILNNQRSALLLADNQVYVAWASHCDIGSYTGWLMSFDKANLTPTAYWTPVPYSLFGGIWMSGGGPSQDTNGDIIVPVANGLGKDAVGKNGNYGNSMVRLSWSLDDGFNVVDYFAPFNYESLDDIDGDFGSSVALLLPDQPGAVHPHLLVVTDKSGQIYLLDRDNLGKWQPNSNSNAVQTFATTSNGLSSPLFWNSTLYYAGGRDYLRAFKYDAGKQQFDSKPTAYLNYPLDNRGSTPSLSANGTANAILWMITDFANAKHAVLHAVQPSNVAVELYNSNMMPDRDTAGLGVKFTVPTVADGMVFVGTQNEVDAYGLLQR